MRSVACPCPRNAEARKLVPAYQNIRQPVFKNEVKEQIRGGRMRPPVFVTVRNRQAVGLCRLLESLVVVGIPTATVLYAILIVEVMHHLM